MPVAVGSVPSVALVAFDSRSVKVSFSSAALSPVVATLTPFSVCPAVKISAPFAAVKSPDPAVSPLSADAAQSTLTSLPLAAVSRTVKVTARPSVADAFPTLSTGAPSSSSIVPVAVGGSGNVALVAFVSRTVKVSFASSSGSPVVATVTVFSVCPAVKVSPPFAAVKSPDPAVSPLSADAAQSTVTACVLAADSRTVKVTAWPSVADALPTLSTGARPTAPVGALASVFANPPLSW